MAILAQYSIVCQAPGAEPYTICAYSGEDLSKVFGITQADLPDSHYGWIQQCGQGIVSVSGQAQPAYADFRPNTAKHQVELLLDENPIARNSLERLSQLQPLLMEDGHYCGLVREARDVFVDGHFYACVAMCGISFERFQRDKAEPYGAKKYDKMPRVQTILQKNRVISPETLSLCESMAALRNKYAHGHGLHPKEDALKSLGWMHSFIANETDLMRDYVIVDGILSRKRAGFPGLD